MMPSYESKNTKILFGLVVLFLVVGVVYLIWPKKIVAPVMPSPPEEVACTMEAKMCPDGKTFVGRVGPNCEFAACPSPTVETPAQSSNLSTTTNGITFFYPAEILTTYIHTVDWPPKVQVTTTAFTCTQAGSQTAPAGETKQVTINTHTYCITKEIEGAAGSMYTSYAVAFPKGNKTIFFTFSLRSVQCGNYDDPQKTACEKEQNSFDINSIIDSMAQSVT